jgi:hypothetical protein
MPLFQLDPQSIAQRVQASGQPPRVPTLGASVLRGIIGFTLVSVAGFAPWPIIDRWFPWMGEMGLYVVCTAVFIGLSGPLLHRLIIGPGSLPRFYKVFTLAFTAYVIAWAAFWIWLRSDVGEITGLLGGTAAMGAIVAFAFDSRRAVVKIIAALFVLNAAGYLAGRWFGGKLGIDHRLTAILLWGICYGIGFGAGLGMAFHFCQARARAVIGDGSTPRAGV